MKRLLIAAAFATATSCAAFAQEAPSHSPQAPGPGAVAPLPPENEAAPDTGMSPDAQAPAERIAPPPSSPDKSAGAGTQPNANGSLALSDDEAKAWIGKAVYSSDGKQIGEVADLKRGAGNSVTELHVDIGGILGLGATRVAVTPEQFHAKGDTIVLSLNEAEAAGLPAVEPAPSSEQY